MTTEEPAGFPIKTPPGSVQRSQLAPVRWRTERAFCTQNLQLTGSPAIPRDGEWAPMPHKRTPALLLAFPLSQQRFTEGPLPAGSCRAEWGALDVLSRGLGLKEQGSETHTFPLNQSICTYKGEAPPGRRGEQAPPHLWSSGCRVRTPVSSHLAFRTAEMGGRAQHSKQMT